MSEDLRERLDRFAGSVAATDPGEVIHAGRRRRRRQVLGGSLLGAVAAAALVVGIAVALPDDAQQQLEVAQDPSPATSDLVPPGTSGWHTVAELAPVAVRSANAIDGRFGVSYGGRLPDGSPITAALVVDLDSGKVEELTAPFGSGENSALVASDGRFLICCGESGTSAAMLDPAALRWSEAAAPPGIFGVITPGASWRSQVHLLASTSPTIGDPHPDVLASYDPANDSWSTLDLPADGAPLSYYAEIVTGGEDLVLHDRSMTGDRLWRLGDDSNWQELPTPPMNDAALAVNGSDIYVWGQVADEGVTALHRLGVDRAGWVPVASPAISFDVSRWSEGTFGSATVAFAGDDLLLWPGSPAQVGDGVPTVGLLVVEPERAASSLVPAEDQPFYRPVLGARGGQLVVLDGGVHVAAIP